MRSFEVFINQLHETNQTLDFFCDFPKITKNVEEIKLSLCILNSLIGSADLRKSVEAIWNRDRSAFNVMNILIAVRNDGNKKILDQLGQCVPIESMFDSIDGVMAFLDKTGLSEVFKSRRIKDLVDYVFGIETGLDTNARKNRSGHIMEEVVADLFRKYGVKFRQEVYSREWRQISRILGSDEKRFDFVIKTKDKIYLIEVNFYSGGGSKLNEVARAYSEIGPKINSVSGFEFVWITDGIGWRSAKNKLHEAYNNIPRVYNLTNIGEFIDTVRVSEE